MPAKDEENRGAVLQRIGELLGSQEHEDYESLKGRMIEARKLFHELVAERLTARFNAYLASQPQETAKQKQSLARKANADLRELGLAIASPRTNEPAHLRGMGDTPSGRFQICLTADARYGARITSQTLPHFTLVMRPATRVGSDRDETQPWVDRVSNKGGQKPDKKGPRG